MTATALAMRMRPAIAPAVVAGSVAVTVVGLVFACTRPTVENLVQGHLLGDAAAAIVAAMVGGLLLTRVPGQPVGLLLSAVGVAGAVAVLASGVQSARPADLVALWAAEWTWVPGTGLLLLLPVVVPNGARPRGERVLLVAGIVATAVATVGAATQARLASGPETSVANPFALAGGDAVQDGGIIAIGVLAIAGLVVLVRRVVLADAALRRQLLPFLAAGLLAVSAVAVAPWLGLVGVVLQDLMLLLVPVACLVSVLRLRLYDLEVAIGRSVVWVGVTAILVGGYVAIVELAGRLLRLPDLPSSIVATALVALAFAPVRAGLQRAVGRWLYGGRGDPSGALAAITRLLAEHGDTEEALARAALAVAAALRVPDARVLRDGRILAGGRDGVAAVAVPLRMGEREVGLLEVLPRSPGERFSRSDERLLADLAPALAAGVTAVVAQEELLGARSALALERETDRRRVRAQLHDDVGPGLAAAAMQAQTALRRLARSDEAGTHAALEQVATTIGRAAHDLRSAVDVLGPRALDELGLGDAVAALASSAGGDALTVVASTDVLPPLPPAVEAAAYRIVAESLTNVVRHAGAQHASVVLRVDGGALVVSVADDGTAGPLGRPGGVGIGSMRARAEELGGSLEITQADGTTVVARLPLGGGA